MSVSWCCGLLLLCGVCRSWCVVRCSSFVVCRCVMSGVWFACCGLWFVFAVRCSVCDVFCVLWFVVMCVVCCVVGVWCSVFGA